jgi:hypothetical protein
MGTICYRFSWPWARDGSGKVDDGRELNLIRAPGNQPLRCIMIITMMDRFGK